MYSDDVQSAVSAKEIVQSSIFPHFDEFLWENLRFFAKFVSMFLQLINIEIKWYPMLHEVKQIFEIFLFLKFQNRLKLILLREILITWIWVPIK